MAQTKKLRRVPVGKAKIARRGFVSFASPILIVQYPIAVGPGGLVVNGHARLAAARDCGVEEASAVQVRHPDIQMHREAR
jgi:hypothetical protein